MSIVTSTSDLPQVCRAVACDNLAVYGHPGSPSGPVACVMHVQSDMAIVLTDPTHCQSDSYAGDACDTGDVGDLLSDDDEMASDDSLHEFLADDSEPIPITNTPSLITEVNPANIVEGKRIRKTTQRFVPANLAALMLEDVPPEEVHAALGLDEVESEESDDDDDDDEASLEDDDDDDDDDDEDSEDEYAEGDYESDDVDEND